MIQELLLVSEENENLKECFSLFDYIKNSKDNIIRLLRNFFKKYKEILSLIDI